MRDDEDDDDEEDAPWNYFERVSSKFNNTTGGEG